MLTKAFATKQALFKLSCSDVAVETIWLQIALYAAGAIVGKNGLSTKKIICNYYLHFCYLKAVINYGLIN